MRRWGVLVVAATAAVIAAPLLAPSAASAGTVEQSAVVSADPANFTPNVLDGEVDSIAQVGDLIVLGGTFTQVQSVDGSQTYARNNVVAFNATTGAVTSFDPEPDGAVTTVIASADGQSVYLAGKFNTVSGQTRRKVAQVDLATGDNVSGFRNVAANGVVKDMRLVGNQLWVAGAFTSISGSSQAQLATLNATTGAADPFMGLSFAGTKHGGTTSVNKIDVTPDHTKLVGIGNFLTVDGQSRSQIFMLDISGASAALANWSTNFYTATCSSSFDTYMRDLDFAPDGSYFVVSTTGAYNGSTSACDTQARFNTDRTGTTVTPEWVSTTGGDTTYAVEVTGSAVYVGGHFRWLNNSFAGDKAGAGAVAREGIAALDPDNGLPLSWNPGRTRGVGVFDMLATSTGLWVGSDTDRIGNYEYHGRIAFFPLSGGETIQATPTATLPAGIVSLSPQATSGTSTAPSDVRLSQFTGTAVTQSSQTTGATSWSSVKGAFMLNGYVYLANSDGTFVKRSFDGTTWGSATSVNTQDLIVSLTAWHTNVSRTTGMFYDDGRIYYTQSNDSTLHMRYFTAEDDVVGALDHTQSTVSGLDLTKTRGMFRAGDSVFLIQSDGSLVRVGWSDGSFVAGTVTTVSGPKVDGVNWTSTASFPYQGANGATLNFPPTAQAAASCTDQTCTFSSAGSTDTDGSIASYAWDFGDGATSTAANPTHAYTASGTYTIKLTVTDNDGAQTSTTISQAVTFVDTPPTASFTSSCKNWDCTFDGSASTDAEGPIASYAWDFGDDTTAATGATASHSYTADGDYTVTLEVTDSAGQTTKTQKVVDVTYVYSPPTASYTYSCDSLTCSFDASGSSDPDGPIASYAWDFGDGTTGTGVTSDHTFSTSGSYDVKLVVTDGQNTTAQKTQTIDVNAIEKKISFVDSASSNRNAATHPVTVPSSAQAGDLLVLMFTSNSPTTAVTAPAGWTETAAPAASGVVGRVWTKVATASDIGSTVTETSAAVVKADATLLVYRGVDTTSPISAVKTDYATTGTSYTTPTVDVPQNGELVSYWAVKTSESNVFTAPGDVTTRSGSSGSGSGNIAALAADEGPLAAGSAGGLTATTSASGNKAFTVSLALQPAD